MIIGLGIPRLEVNNLTLHCQVAFLISLKLFVSCIKVKLNTCVSIANLRVNTFTIEKLIFLDDEVVDFVFYEDFFFYVCQLNCKF